MNKINLDSCNSIILFFLYIFLFDLQIIGYNPIIFFYLLIK